MRYRKIVKTTLKPNNNTSDRWRCLTDNVASIVILFVKNRKKYVTNIPEMNKMQQ